MFVIINLWLLNLSWELKNFQFLLLSITLFLIIIAFKFKRLRDFSIPIISSLITIIIFEYLALFALPNAQNLLRVDSRYYERISGLGYRPRPGQYKVSNTAPDGEIIYDVVYTIAKDGYRKDIISDNYDVLYMEDLLHLEKG